MIGGDSGARALHTDGRGCTLSVGREVKMEIPANTMYLNIGIPDLVREAFPPAPGPVMLDADLEPAFAGTKSP